MSAARKKAARNGKGVSPTPLDRPGSPAAGRPRTRKPAAPPAADTIGRRIAAARNRAGISQASAAAAAGIGQPYWADIEGGHKEPTLAVLRKIATALGCQPADLLPAEK